MARKSILHHDLETRSAIDLTQSGQYAYAIDRTTKILCLSWAVDDAKVSTWYPFLGQPMPKELEDAFTDPEVELGAHNAGFERILQVTSPARPQKLLPERVVKAIRPLSRWNCTAARAAYMGLPRSLDKAALALNLPFNKDLEGKKLMLKMCKPTGRALDGSFLWHMNDADLFRLGAYCDQDVEVERGIDKALPLLPPQEREVWEATERMNDRGVQVDDKLLLAMVLFVNEAEERVNRNIRDYTDGIVPKVTNSKKMLEWLHARGYTHLPSGAPIKGVGKDIIRDLLGADGLPDIVREVLLTRQEGNKSSSSKYKAVLTRLNNDKRIRGSIVYSGAASTHRFCLGEGTLIPVKTDVGIITEKPIQDVLLTDLVWDGDDWVSHEGVVFSGDKEVITHDGVTATVDHEVFVDDNTKISLGDAKSRGIPLFKGNKSSVAASSLAAVNYACHDDTKIMRTYDIINAGPKNRFMANGRIVSNSSKGAQLQNLPRGGTIKKIDDALLAVLNGASADQVAADYGAPMVVASELVRPTFIAPPRHWLARGDYAQVELRAGAFLAGQNNALQGFRDYDTILGIDERGKPIRKGPDRYRVTAAGIFQVPVEEIEDDKRQGGKIGDLACIARGSLVTTDQGLVPIQNVTRDMRVWDGVEWVNHDGVISRGKKKVIEYAGLQATEDHLVFCQGSAQPIPFGEIAAGGFHLVRSEPSWACLRPCSDNKLATSMEREKEPFVRRSEMPFLFSGELDKSRVFDGGEKPRMPKLLRTGERPLGGTDVASKANGGRTSTLHQHERSGVPELRGPRYPIPLSVPSGCCGLDDGKLGVSEGSGGRPNRQQWSLRTGESEMVFPLPTVSQSTPYQSARGSDLGQSLCSDDHTHPSTPRDDAARNNGSCAVGGSGEAQELVPDRNEVEVFDIVNAGPRHRFTVSGVLVHNCGFGGGKGAFQAFAKIYNFLVSDAEAQRIVDGWRAANPFVVQFWQDLEDNAIACMRARPGTRFVIKTIRAKPKHAGRPFLPGLWFVRGKNALVLRLPSGNCLFYWYPKIEKKTTPWGESDQVTYMAEDSQTKQWKRWSMWGGLTCENAVQSFARDIMARAIVRMDKAGLSPVLTVHDEGIGQIPFDMAPTAEQAAELVRREMLATEEWYARMPLAVDASAGPRYAKA